MNITDQYIFAIAKAPVYVNLTINGIEDNNTINYGTQANATAVMNITGNNTYVGGVVGNNYNSQALIENVYATKNVSIIAGQDTIYKGSLVGYNSLGASLSYCYYNSDATALGAIGVNNASDNHNLGIGAVEFSNPNTYSNAEAWDFLNVWVLPPEEYNIKRKR